MKPEYVSLHQHTHNSILDGYSKTEEYIEAAIKLGHRGFGETDHGNLFGTYDFLKKVRSAGLLAVPGIEFYVAPENPEGAKHIGPIFYATEAQRKSGKSKYDVSSKGAYLHLTAWAYNNVGLHNLFKLSTLSNDPSRFYQKPRIDFNLLAEYSEGIIVSTGCPSSEISTRFLLEQDDKAYEYAGRLKEVFGENLYVEIMDHNMPIDLERRLLPKQLKLSQDLNLKLLATNDCHYAYKGDSVSHEELLCVQSAALMSDPTYDEGGGRFAFNGTDYYLKSAEEMAANFPDDKFPNALKNSLTIAEMASDVKLEFDPRLKPKPIIPEEFKTELDYYKYLIKKGFHERYDGAPREIIEEAKRRNEHEFDVIYSSDFIGYMLVVRDYLDWAKRNYSTRNDKGDILALSIGVGRGCFEPGSRITTGQGSEKNIENIKFGDRVRTHDTSYQTVEHLFEYDVVNEDMIELTLDNGRIIKSTADHMIFHKDKGFTKAQDFIIGDTVLGAKKRREIFEYKCANCSKIVKIDKQELDKKLQKAYYKPINEYWCYDCVKSKLHLIPSVVEGSLKGSLANKNEASRKKNSESIKKHWKEHADYRRKIWAEYAKSDEYRAKCSERNLKRYSDAEQLLKLTSHKNKKYDTGIFYSFNQNGKGIYYASSYEKKALNIFETSSNIKFFDRSKLRVPYISSFDNKEHNYLPDFEVHYLNGVKKIIEIKAQWQLNELKTSEKLKQARRYIEKKGYIFEIWTEKELAELNDAWHNEYSIVKIRKYKYTGKVYDLQVSNVHNYTIEGITVHNSVGGSIHAYELGISEIDPIEHDLIFERFLSAGRGATERIEYEDGTYEDIIVSEKKKVLGEDGKIHMKYVHQIQPNDTIVEEDEENND